MAQPIVERASRTLALDDSPSDLMPQPAPGQPGDRPEDPIQDIIIRSKVRAPVLRDSTLSRARLLEWMDQHADERVRMLVAEAGFGKTTLLADWARRTIQPVRWLKLDATDAEWALFISYLVAAFQEGSPNFGSATLGLLGHVATLGVTREQATGQLLAELGAIISEPTVLIIDDVQHVAGNEDVQHVIGRLLERAPHHLRFVLSGRGTPELKLGRLTAQGSVVSLGTDDLRFTRQELGELFRVGYHMPLDADLLGVVDERTEGWAASLQLLHSSLRGQQKAEIREFITVMGGTRRPLYDFLAEEVLGHQAPLMQQILLHASVADRVIASWVTAAMSVTPEPPSEQTVEETLAAADELGLMSRNAKNASSRRFHPLLQEFLREHLRKSVSPATMRAIHLAIARVAEDGHWPTSAHHFIEAGEGAEAMRVIGDATMVAIGSGSIAPAMKLLARISDQEPSDPVKAIMARAMARFGQADQALQLLEGIDVESIASPRDRAVIRLAHAYVLSMTTRDGEVPTVVEPVASDPDAPRPLRALARAWRDMASENNQVSIRSMEALVSALKTENLHMYSALAYHNLAIAKLAHANPDAALADAEAALRYFELIDEDDGTAASTKLAIAHCYFEMGDFGRADTWMADALRHPDAAPDALAEAALLHLWMGDLSHAVATADQGGLAWMAGGHQATGSDALQCAASFLALAHGRAAQAATHAHTARASLFDQNQGGLILTARAAAAVAAGTEDASAVVAATLDELDQRRIRRWVPHVRLLASVASGDMDQFRYFFSGPQIQVDSVLLVLADALDKVLGRLDSPPSSLERNVKQWPLRWRPVLRRVLTDGAPGSGFAAAALLAEVGDESDARLLQQWERHQKKWVHDSRYSVRLAKRISPTLVIRDLGRTALTLGDRSIPITGVRRRAASLLLFLVSRPRQTATREQVLDALWPEMDPVGAGNSLHQTLFFLRRELVEIPKGEKPLVEYVPVAGDVIHLVPELVHVDSVAFLRQAGDVATKRPESAEALSLVKSYTGSFAPEFEYEEWAMPWRDHVHSVFLSLAERAARARLPDRAPEAAAILRHALEVDPSAIELKALLAAATYMAGSHAAARVLYQQYVHEALGEFGEEPPPLAHLVAQFRQS